MPGLLNRSIVLIGGGGHCRSVVDSIKASGLYKDVVITDPDELCGNMIGGFRVIGDDDELPYLYGKGYKEAFISVGSLKDDDLRRKIHRKAQSIGFSFPDIIDPSAAVADDVMIMPGVFVGKKAVINVNSKIGEFAMINSGAIVEHDCLIGEFTHISVGAVVCGGCSIANDVFIGANATVIQEIRIGAHSVVGAGSTVLADVPEHTTVTGVWKGDTGI